MSNEVKPAGRLILSRKVGEEIMIGDHITISVVEIQHGRVRIGIIAPRHIPVHRQEVYRANQKKRVFDWFLKELAAMGTDADDFTESQLEERFQEWFRTKKLIVPTQLPTLEELSDPNT